MIEVHSSNGTTYKFPQADNYKFGDKTIKLYRNSSKIGNFVIENMDCVVKDNIEVIKEEVNSN